MAEAFALIGLAANIVQFVEYSIVLISKVKEIYRSAEGAGKENVEIEMVVQDISNLGANIAAAAHQAGPRTKLSENEKVIHDLAGSSKDIADRLLMSIRALKIGDDSHHRKLMSLRLAFRSIQKKKEVEELEKRLRRVQEQLSRRMIKALNDNQSNLISAVNELSYQNSQIGVETTKRLDQLKLEFLRIADERSHTASTTSAPIHDVSRLLSSFVEEWKTMKREQKILASLCFQEIKERHSDIKEAHATTLDWIYESAEINFMDWLKSRNNIYWVSGKAGSGKSTLMKFVYNNERTLQALRTWAGPMKLITAHHFFWNAGLPMQKSHKGLLQTLLYQMLKQCPALIPSICPRRWQITDSTISEPWDLKELIQVFEQVVKQSVLPAKFCFFIDGLDEYDGIETEIIGILRHLVVCPSFKLCVSSRPWNAFVNAFGESDQKLALQELTKNDMRKYVKDMLEDSRFDQHTGENPYCRSLVPQITEKAQGVWLWVYLVVRSLIRGLGEGDRFELLEKRLNEFPEDLEQYFEHVLNKIEKVYRQETAEIFLIVVQAVRPLPVVAFEFWEQENKEPGYALKKCVQPLPDEDAQKLCKKWRNLLNSRCKDLLEVNARRSEPDAVLKYRVDFLHRTVRDFLNDKNIQDKFRSQSGKQFDPRASLSRMLLGVLKALSLPEGFQSQVNTIFGLVDEFMQYTWEIELFCHRSEVALLDELDRVNSGYAKEAKIHWTNGRDATKATDEHFEEYGCNNFLAFTIQAGLRLYATEKLDKYPEFMSQKIGRPLLDYALRPKRVTPADFPYDLTHRGADIDMGVVSMLLERGANPNQEMGIYDGQTVWNLFLLSCYRACRINRNDVPPDTRKTRYQAAELLVKYGADFSTNEIAYDGTVPLTIQRILQVAFSPEEANQLERLLAERHPLGEGHSLAEEHSPTEERSGRQGTLWWIVRIFGHGPR